MIYGNLVNIPTFQSPDVSSRTFNNEMGIIYTPYIQAYSVALGLVQTPKKVKIYLWNGSTNSVTFSSITASGVTDGITADAATPLTIPPESPLAVVFTISNLGPSVFSATYTFNSNGQDVPTLLLTGTRPVYATDQPRPITLDAAIEEAYAYPNPAVTFYDTLEFTDSFSNTTVQVVHSDENLSTPQGEFTACRFGCSHPETENGVVGVMEITIDFLPREAQKWLMDACKSRGNVSVYWRQYLGPNMEPDAHYPVPLSITSVEQTALGVKASASFPMLTAMKFPRRIMTAAILPGALI